MTSPRSGDRRSVHVHVYVYVYVHVHDHVSVSVSVSVGVESAGVRARRRRRVTLRVGSIVRIDTATKRGRLGVLPRELHGVFGACFDPPR